jgi:DNA-binding beta-propeller fold protein YncE
MDDKSLHDLLDGALVGEPPIGPVAQNSLAAGTRLRRRRRARAAAASVAAAAVIAVAIPASLGTFSRPPGPAGSHRPPTLYVVKRDVSPKGVPLTGTTVVPVNTATNTPGKPVHLKLTSVSSIVFTADGKTAYFLNGMSVIPFNTVTNTPGKPIRVSRNRRDGIPQAIAVTPDGKTVYVVSEIGGRPPYITDTVTPISAATNTPGKPIPVGGRFNGRRGENWEQIAVTPDGKTAYVAAGPTVTPISTATNTPGKPIPVSGIPIGFAITPDGKTAYVADLPVTSGAVTSSTVIPISTATNQAGKPIHIGGGQLFKIAVTPDGKTVYVTTELHKVQSTPFWMLSGTVTPISTATGTPARSIPLSGIGQQTIGEIVITPDGKTAYIEQSGTITPINTATNTPGRPIRVSGGESMTITPDGKTLYVLTGSGTVVPISTATNTPGQPIRIGPTGFHPLMAITP